MTEKKCPVELKPMKDWVQEEDPRGICRECLLAPVLQWYRDELDAKGYSKFVGELNEIARAAEVLPLHLCEKFDKIKGEVEESLRERLEEFDCAAQAYEPEDDS
ncbi:hypothetical protein ES703_95609 [subsurface metagenome]